jgi:hypothetical protein
MRHEINLRINDPLRDFRNASPGPSGSPGMKRDYKKWT